MCGICGVYNFGNKKPVNQQLLKGMSDVIKHRGPDDEGFYIEGEIGLAHRRLSIIDLASGHQPICNEDKTIWIVFNGEIYNYQHLRQILTSKGHIFQTNSDTEAIIHLYEEIGDDFVKDLRGMFAIALWDSKKKKLVLARDRLGKKPVYYLLDDKGRCIFGSEIKSILQYEDICKEINIEALDDYLSFLCVPGDKSIFKGIKKLLPGHIFVCTPEKSWTQEYWDIEFKEDKPSKGVQYYKDNLFNLLKDAVSCRLMSEVPLGAFLSGGIDSSCVVALMSSLQTQPVITSSIGFKEKVFDETRFANIIADKYKTNHHLHIVEPQAVEILSKIVWHFDEPFADSSAVPTYYVSKTAKEHVTVALSGDGGDEVFAGYWSYNYDRIENFFRSLCPDFVRKKVIPLMLKFYPESSIFSKFIRVKGLLTAISYPLEKSFMRSRATFDYQMKEMLYSTETKTRLKDYNPFSVVQPYFEKTNGWDFLSFLQYLDIKTYLPNDILVKVDRMSMAVSLEVRAPLLDHKLIEWTTFIPPDLKLKGWNSKYILKKAMGDMLPKEIQKRKKMGFGVPIGHWFKGELKKMTEEILFSSKFEQRGYFNPDFIRKIWTQHQMGIKDYSSHLWVLLMLELWHQQFID